MQKEVAIFSFAYNEELLIRDWITYYGELAGYSNLHIVNNNSTDETQKILTEFEPQGLQIYECSDFSKKSEYLSEIMRRQRNTYKYLLPLDVDEFIESNNTIEKQRKYHDPLIELTEFYRYTSKEWNKTFFPSTSFIATDGGNHSGIVSISNHEKIETSLGLFHFHFLGYDETYQRSLHFCNDLGYDLDHERSIQELVDRRVSGFHKLMYILAYRNGETHKQKGIPLSTGEEIFHSHVIKEKIVENRSKSLAV